MPAEPRITIARTVSAFSHAASSWSEPITLMSCALRGETRSAAGRRTVWVWRIVPTRGGVVSLGLGGGAADDLVVDERVDARRRDQLRDHRVADVGLDELGALERGARLSRVEPGDVLDVRVLLEPPRQLGAEVAGDARDEDAAAG